MPIIEVTGLFTVTPSFTSLVLMMIISNHLFPISLSLVVFHKSAVDSNFRMKEESRTRYTKSPYQKSSNCVRITLQNLISFPYHSEHWNNQNTQAFSFLNTFIFRQRMHGLRGSEWILTWIEALAKKLAGAMMASRKIGGKENLHRAGIIYLGCFLPYGIRCD